MNWESHTKGPAMSSISCKMICFRHGAIQGSSITPPGVAMIRHAWPCRLRSNTTPREVDKDIDIILITNTASDWWAAIAAVDELLVYHGWGGCSLSARGIGEMAAEFATGPNCSRPNFNIQGFSRTRGKSVTESKLYSVLCSPSAGRSSTI